MSDSKHRIWIVSFEPDGVPQTVDGEWAGALSAHDTEEAAEAEIERIKKDDSGEYKWLGAFEFNEETQCGDTSTRGLRLTRESVPYFPQVRGQDG